MCDTDIIAAWGKDAAPSSPPTFFSHFWSERGWSHWSVWIAGFLLHLFSSQWASRRAFQVWASAGGGVILHGHTIQTEATWKESAITPASSPMKWTPPPINVCSVCQSTNVLLRSHLEEKLQVNAGGVSPSCRPFNFTAAAFSCQPQYNQSSYPFCPSISFSHVKPVKPVLTVQSDWLILRRHHPGEERQHGSKSSVPARPTHIKYGFSSCRLFKGRFFSLRPDMKPLLDWAMHFHKYTHGRGFCRESSLYNKWNLHFSTPEQTGCVFPHITNTPSADVLHSLWKRSPRGPTPPGSAVVSLSRPQLRHQFCSGATPAFENCRESLGITTGTRADAWKRVWVHVNASVSKHNHELAPRRRRGHGA